MNKPANGYRGQGGLLTHVPKARTVCLSHIWRVSFVSLKLSHIFRLNHARSLSSSPPPEKDREPSCASARNAAFTRGFHTPAVCLHGREGSPRDTIDAG